MDDSFAKKAFSGALDELSKSESELIDKNAENGTYLNILMAAADEIGIDKMEDMIETLGDEHHHTFTKYLSAVAYMCTLLGYEAKMMEGGE